MMLIYPLLLVSLSLALECSELLENPSQNDALETVKDKLVSAISDECILLAIEKEWWDIAIALTSQAMDAKQDLGEEIRRKAMARQRKISELIQAFESKPVVQTVSPAFQWA
jgi:hypothetical protein